MNIFGRKKRNDALLMQLSRIADSLEKSQQPLADDPTKAMIEQLNRIADVIEQGNLAETNSDNHELVLQLSKMVDTLERNHQSMPDDVKRAQLVQLDRIANALEQNMPKKAILDEQKKKQAAYALNLCLVSISQIIDYSDLYILEQEYDGILNNLNLEHMPKDEALLDILRQILDTITFFRIQEGDKQFIEKEYQDKMKTAIWSAVPSCGAILACPDPTAMLLTLVTQVGTGYMNYRKAKAEAGREKEKAEWELHKAAIEQFNGLRRELFTTAWKLADSYGFSDEWRLTESQIAQYNRVLTDQNLSRRLARLEDLEEKFKAYPQFWYFKGNTALNLTQSKDLAVSSNALNTARAAYKQYFEINTKDNALLRTDPICAACALEYVSLIDDHEKELKIEYIERAIDCAGTHFDILQMCAMAYLDIGETEAASRILRTLVCEGYNESVNAQLLSSLYIVEFIKTKGAAQCEASYAQLCALTNEKNLIPWPRSGESTETQYQQFVSDSRTRLLEAYAKFLYGYYTDKTDLFIKAFGDGVTEAQFVQFVRQIETELNSIPYVGIDEEQFAKLMSTSRTDIDKFIEGKIDATSKTFDNFFKEMIWTAAENVSSTDLSTMEQIANADIQLTVAMNRYLKGKAEEHETASKPEYTIDSLCRIPTNTSENFKKIKEKVRSLNLVKKPKHTTLLVAGEMEYYRYISDHGLGKMNVVAVINDKTLRDCDLLITEKGLLVHQGQSKASKTAKAIRGWAVGGVVGGLVVYGAGELIQWFKDEVSYASIQFGSKKLIAPSYRNDAVDMDQLIALIHYCQSEFKNEIEDGIRKKLAKNVAHTSQLLDNQKNLCVLKIHKATAIGGNCLEVTAGVRNAPVSVGTQFLLIQTAEQTKRILEVVKIGLNGETEIAPNQVRTLTVKGVFDPEEILDQLFVEIKENDTSDLNEKAKAIAAAGSGIIGDPLALAGVAVLNAITDKQKKKDAELSAQASKE